MTSKRLGSGKFGWCMDDLHDRCIAWLVNSDRRCTCDCHLTRRETHVNTVDSTTFPEVVVPSWSPPAQEPTVTEVVTEVIAAASEPAPKVDAQAVRAWARAQGISVGARGRVNPEVIARYNEAHGAVSGV